MATYDNTSPLYRVRKWRNVPQETEDALEDFLAWLRWDDQSPVDTDEPEGEKTLKQVASLVDAYLGRTPKVSEGEALLLQRWVQSVEGG